MLRFSRALPCLFAMASAAALGVSAAGCVDTVGQARVEPASSAARVARRDGVSPRGATIVLSAVDGGPEQINGAFAEAFAQTASAHELTIADNGKAAYLVRAYLTAYPEQQGVTRLAYVFDVFDRSKRRVQRLSDDIAIKAGAADPWALADSLVVKNLAERSAADLADALTNTPEAIAAASIASAAGTRGGETKISRSGTTSLARSAADADTATPRLGLAATR